MDVDEWLLAGDPAIRWQVLRDLHDVPAEEVVTERARVEHEGWGAALLAAADDDGQWAGGACFPEGWDWRSGEPGQPWTATMHSLQTLVLLGLPPDCPSATRAVEQVAASCRWEHDGQRFFDGEVEPCINGRTVETGAYVGVDVSGIVDRLLDERLSDGGWNCEVERGATTTSVDTTINVLDGLLMVEERLGPDPAVDEARRGAEEYLLERGLFRRASTGEVMDDDFLRFSFPYYWHFDVLRGLDHLRAAGRPADPRLSEAIQVVRSRRQPDGRWLLDQIHPGRVHLDLEDEGDSSRWNTLRALRVLRWWDGDG